MPARYGRGIPGFTREKGGAAPEHDGLAVLLDALPAWVSYIDSSQRFVWVNRTYEEMYDLPRAQIVGRSIVEVHGEAAYTVIRPHLEQALAGERVQYEAVIQYANGAVREIDARYVPDVDSAGQVQGCFVLVTDVSARRRTDRLAALGTLAAGIAHEVNNPAASILAAAQMARALLDVPGSRDEVDAALARIADEAARFGRIVRSILGFARNEPGGRHPGDLNLVVTRALELVRGTATAAGVELRFEPAAALPQVALDESELTQVVINLANNAIEAGSARVSLRTKVHEGGVALVVEDDGIGIRATELPRVCDPFYTSRSAKGGTGLGLSLSDEIVARHGGRLQIASVEGAGTTVTVELPALGG